LAWSPDGKRLAVSRADGTIAVSDPATGKQTLALAAGGMSAALAWSPDGKRLASAAPGLVRVWDTAGGQVALTVRDPSTRVAPPMAWGRDGDSFATVGHVAGSEPGSLLEEVTVWDLGRGRPVLVLRRTLTAGPFAGTVALAWDPIGRHLAARRADRVTTAWDVATGVQVLTLPSANPGFTESVAPAWSPDGKRLTAFGFDGTLRVGDADTGEVIISAAGRPVPLPAPAWSPDGKRLAAADGAGQLKVWDVAEGKPLHKLPWGNDALGMVAWSVEGRYLAAVGTGKPGGLRAWDAETGKEIRLDGAAAGAWTWLAWGPGGRLAAGDAATAHVWGVATGKQLLTPPLAMTSQGWLPHTRSVGWSADGQLAVANPDWTVRVWNATTGKEAPPLGRSRGVVPAAAFPQLTAETRVVLAWSGDGKRLASSSSVERTIQVWDAATGARLLASPAQSQELLSLAWSRDGGRLASAAEDGTLKIWHTATGKESLALRYAPPSAGIPGTPRPRGEALLAWGPGGQLAVAGGDGAVTIWDAATGKEVVSLSAPRAPVSSVAWSPDGRRLASAGGDGTVSLWDVSAGQEVFTVRSAPPPGGRTGALAWSPDGRLALSLLGLAGAGDGVVTVWEK
jgi:WD40 repeat protein